MPPLAAITKRLKRDILANWDVAKWLRHQVLILAFAGSSPAIPAIYCGARALRGHTHLRGQRNVRSWNQIVLR